MEDKKWITQLKKRSSFSSLKTSNSKEMNRGLNLRTYCHGRSSHPWWRWLVFSVFPYCASFFSSKHCQNIITILRNRGFTQFSPALTDCIKQYLAAVFTSVSDAPPSHYIVKLQSFSLLTKNNIEKYISADFQAGGYKWCYRAP